MAILAAPYKQCPEGADYGLTLSSGAMTVVAAAGPVWACHWTSPSLICVVKRMRISLAVTTAFTNAQEVAFGLYFARPYTVAATAGLAATLTVNNGKYDTSYRTTAMADMRIGDTDVITLGTWTLDAQPVDTVAFGATGLGQVNDQEMNFGMTPGRQELIIRPNEGLVLNNMAVMGAVGVVMLRVTMEWAEVSNSAVK